MSQSLYVERSLGRFGVRGQKYFLRLVSVELNVKSESSWFEASWQTVIYSNVFTGVSVGCVGKCASNPCLNNGTCIDRYSSYTCDCRWTSFKGPICADGNRAWLIFICMSGFGKSGAMKGRAKIWKSENNLNDTNHCTKARDLGRVLPEDMKMNLKTDNELTLVIVL